jgi:polar amino acid transport system substrate-binding protein
MRPRSSWVLFAAALLLCACSTAFAPPGSVERNELVPTGKLRFGVVAGVVRTEFYVVKKSDGEPEGVAVDLARELARRLDVPVEFTVASSSGELTELLLGGKLDAAIMLPDKWGGQRLDFGSYYFADRDTYMVRGRSRLKTVGEVDNLRVRVIAVEGSTTDRNAARRLKNTRVNPVDSIDEALEMLRTGNADAFAFTHASLAPLVPLVPDSRILDGSFERVGLAFAIPKNRPNGLFYIVSFTEEAKGSGLVRRAFDNAGLQNSKVAARNDQYPLSLRPKVDARSDLWPLFLRWPSDP